MARNLTQQPDTHIPPELIGATRFVTPKQFERLCQKYRDLRLELTSTGELIVMPGTGGQTGVRNAHLTSQLWVWSENDKTGVCFDSSTLFALPNNARRSPDASWVRREKWDSLTPHQKNRIPPICPDFVIELRSPTDRLSVLFNKMAEYLENGASLGWLIDPNARRIYVYQRDEEVVILDNPESVSAEPLLRGFTLKTAKLW